MVRLAGIALMLTFEKELKAALLRAGVLPSELPQTLENLVVRAYRFEDSDQLQRIALAARKGDLLGHSGHRNRATHGDRFTLVDLEKVAQLLLTDGLDGKGLIGLLVRSRRG